MRSAAPTYVGAALRILIAEWTLFWEGKRERFPLPLLCKGRQATA